MNDLFGLVVLALFLGFLPPAIGYWRRLDDWTMARVWLWMLLPGLGWCISLSVALDAPSRR